MIRQNHHLTVHDESHASLFLLTVYMKEETDKRDAIYYLSEAVIFQRDMMKAKIAV